MQESRGVVSAPYFQQHFGLLNPDGSKNTARLNAISSNIIFVLHAGAFFGSLVSVPLSGCSYYAPQIFTAIGYTGQKNSLFASGIYGIAKVVAAILFICFGIETLGRKGPLFISSIGMGTLFIIIGMLLKKFPPPIVAPNVEPPPPPPVSEIMAGLLYIYVCFYAMGWGPLPFVYVADIFPTSTRHYGLALASASNWIWDFVTTRVTPDLITSLGYNVFLMFGILNIVALGGFALFLPETKGRSLEEMDIIFGSISAEQRQSDIEKHERGLRGSPASLTLDKDSEKYGG